MEAVEALAAETLEETEAFEQIDFLDDTFGSVILERNCYENIIGKLEDYDCRTLVFEEAAT